MHSIQAQKTLNVRNGDIILALSGNVNLVLRTTLRPPCRRQIMLVVFFTSGSFPAKKELLDLLFYFDF